MKEIKAYIKSNMLSEVIKELHKIERLTGVSVTDMKGFGREKGEGASVRIVDNMISYVPHVNLEIICHNDLVETVITAIQKGAHTGLSGDGKIYILPVEDALRISSGERGEEAV
ncbi:MAG: P-II family nitrogen regulator [bacterium]|nr:P-II family nitrogen regulator [bacterium]